jgi:hypothetical protein
VNSTQAFPPAMGISQPQIHATFTYQRTRKAIQQKKHDFFFSKVESFHQVVKKVRAFINIRQLHSNNQIFNQSHSQKQYPSNPKIID